MTILGVDVGTTGMKMGVYRLVDGQLVLVRQFSREYPINVYNDGLFADIGQDRWREAFMEGCSEMAGLMADVDAVALSGTTPGMSAMDADGEAVYPAILMLDQRSRIQARRIIDTIGITDLLALTGNMPVAGGCALASILWIKDNHPELFNRTACFGHSNTYMARWLTGRFAIDPSSASLTALYNLAANDLSWNTDIAGTFGLSTERLPELMPAGGSAGRVLPDIASRTGLVKEPPVIIGGNDAVLAAYSVGIREPGDIINVNGTCEISLVCLPRCIASTGYNVRAHVLPGRWLTLYVMNAGGKAYEWFHGVFCNDMDRDYYFKVFVPEAIDAWLERESGVTYVPYLMGSRYSQEPLRAGFTGINQETTREEMLAAMTRGLCRYQREHLREIAVEVPLARDIHITGGAVNDAIVRAKRRWMRDCDFVPEEQSSMKGAAMLGRTYIEDMI